MLIATLFLLLASIAMGVPIAFSLIASSAAAVLFFGDTTLDVFGVSILSGINSYVLLAIPFFILTGELANRGRLINDLIDFSIALFGWVRGGVILATVGACVFFAGITGSTVAEAAALLPVVYPIMKASGYPPAFSANLIGSASTFGIIIPPSVIMILFGVMTQTPVDKLFVAGIVPGILLAVLLSAVALFISWRKGYGRAERFEARRLPRSFVSSSPTLAIPLIVVVGIYSGWMTPTEVAAFVCVYTLVVGLLRRSLSLRDLYEAGAATVRQTAIIYLILVGATMFAFILTSERVPQKLVQAMTNLGLGATAFLVALAGIYLVLGCFFDGFSLLLMTTPVVFPAAVALGINPLHLAVVLTVGIQIAVLTPPVGMNLFVMASVTKLPMEALIREIVPFIAVLTAGLVLTILWPGLSTWLPAAMK
jgi:C4-dicarboxylate transporter, DctM subunit